MLLVTVYLCIQGTDGWAIIDFTVIVFPNIFFPSGPTGEKMAAMELTDFF